MRILDGRRLAGIITETEAYIGEKDLGCHAKAGRTSAPPSCSARRGTPTSTSPTASTGC